MLKDILLVFAFLLIILTLISALGGSIKYTERFVDAPSPDDYKEKLKSNPPSAPPTPPSVPTEQFANEDEEPAYEPFEGDMYAAINTSQF